MRLPLLGAALLLAAALLLPACNTFPVMAEPRIQISPYLAEYRLGGDIAMQNDPGTGPEDNAPQSLGTFGLDHYKDDVGIRADVGDGFAGLRLDYYRLDQNTSRVGALTDDFGALLTSDVVRMTAKMDEWRLSWTENVWREHFSYRDQPVDVRLALGGVWALRRLDMDMQTDDGLRRQSVDHDGDAFYAAMRFRAGMGSVAVDVEYAICPELQTGDWTDVMHDLEARLSYSVPFQDVTLFAGYRYSTLNAEGTEDGLAFDSELTIDGFQFGVVVSF
jgi:hypothetical protein